MDKAERKFGSMPEWAKTGPIDAHNYSYRAEAHCAIKSLTREGSHPTLTLTSPDLPVWTEYFDRWLRNRPLCFRMLMDASIKEMTVPEPVPQWFDPSFIPTTGTRSAA
jgi:hypothetical protein